MHEWLDGSLSLICTERGFLKAGVTTEIKEKSICCAAVASVEVDNDTTTSRSIDEEREGGRTTLEREQRYRLGCRSRKRWPWRQAAVTTMSRSRRQPVATY